MEMGLIPRGKCIDCGRLTYTQTKVEEKHYWMCPRCRDNYPTMEALKVRAI